MAPASFHGYRSRRILLDKRLLHTFPSNNKMVSGSGLSLCIVAIRVEIKMKN